ncbi:DUF2946 family protein [Pseudorhodoplanes sinuspersici]|uniref:Uncharacterized protein n=1 Tax=Pseudorhodoplanes sinuspersici TaxID=1235591 RepID=A0A1W6ZNK8_9HYPH|nr:DUF2946 family protein [Pseudorhodoplanes sinuspersici]ARP98902.1 hypothetical protein CAK95_07280 [Pseudorhodoplanes sinuspersici]RKE69471.1 DUF2946 family protein [Pseudorhodoplanes sinuspersici]
MKGLFTRGRVRAAVGLIAAYAIALQTLLAAFSPLPANASGADFGQLSVICFGSGSTTPSDDGGAPQHSAKYHCVLCGSLLAGAALTPDPVAIPLRRPAIASTYAPTPDETLRNTAPARAGPARAPPLTV